MSGTGFPRRVVFQGLGALGVAAVLAGCGGDEGGTGSDDTPVEGGAALASTADVPVGGGLILTDEGIVLTQPTEGEFHAFSSACTHQGCDVTEVGKDSIDCACHGSRFDVSTGEPVVGPATAPLSEVRIRVEGDRILAA
ncbi:MAG TPA: Rieske (2Fe-2S) protein [Nocardioides sp.]|nr:Rieske (2Fe-2S) protein [Nocardioides sp.]